MKIRLSPMHWLLLVALFLLFALLRMPASVVGAAVAKVTRGQVRFAAADGSIWHGSAQPLLNGAALGDRLRWDWRARELLHGRLGYALALNHGAAQIAIGLNDISITDASMDIAADPIFALDKRSRTFGLSGRFHIGASSFRDHGGKADGMLTIDWLGAGSRLVPAISPLGDYRVAATAAPRGWNLQFSTLNGRLTVNGTGNWARDKGLSVDIGVGAAPGSETAIAPLLNSIGPGAPDAVRRLRFTLS